MNNLRSEAKPDGSTLPRPAKVLLEDSSKAQPFSQIGSSTRRQLSRQMLGIGPERQALSRSRANITSTSTFGVRFRRRRTQSTS